MATFLACILSGALLILAYPKPDLGGLAWLALAPFFWAVSREERPLPLLGSAFAGGWLFFSGLLYWIYFTCRAGGVPPVWSAAGWLALAAVLALDWVLVAGTVHFLRKAYGQVTPGLAAIAWVGVEYLRARWTTQFPWELLGYTQWRHPLLLQICSFTGVYGLSFLVASFGAALGLTAERLGKRSAFELARLWTVPVLGLALTAAYGAASLGRLPPPGRELEAAILQPNIDQYKKWDRDYEAEIKANFQSLQAELEQPPRPILVLWPESAIPGWLDEKESSDWVEGLVRRSKAFTLLGAVTRQGGRRYNGAFLYSPEGSLLGFYYKRQLVPFGERVPLQSLLGRFVPVLNELGAFDAGSAEQEPIKSFLGSFEVAVCYEAIFPHLVRNASLEGSRFLVNVTNDGWYLDTAGPYQHFAMSVLRAPENRAYLLRAANTGISALVDPYGRILAQTALNQRSAFRVRIPMGYSNLLPSVHAQLGDVFAGLCLACLAFLLMAGLLPARFR